MRLRVLLPLLMLFNLTSIPICAEELRETALITLIEGDVRHHSATESTPLAAFVKVRQGDQLLLKNAKLRLIYFAAGRQEVWHGTGKLEIANGKSLATGLAPAEIKNIPEAISRQIARTPSSTGLAGTTRLRNLSGPEAIARIESIYRQQRQEAAADDLNPELYLLSGLFELREFDQLRQTLQTLQKTHPNNMEIGVLASLYKKAIRNAVEANNH